MRWSRWAVVDKAIDDWGKTTRFCLILIVIAGCAVGSLVLAAWLLAAHGIYVDALYRAVVRVLSR